MEGSEQPGSRASDDYPQTSGASPSHRPPVAAGPQGGAPPYGPAAVPSPAIDKSEGAPAPAGSRSVDGRGSSGGRSRRGRYAHVDLSSGSVPKHLWHLAWPQWLENVLGVIESVTDLFWAGRLPAGHRAIAGLGVAQTFIQFGPAVRVGFDQGLRAMVSRAVGAGDIALANHIAWQSFTLTFIYCLLLVAIGWFLTDVLLGTIGVSEAVRAATAMYMRVQFMGMATTGLRVVAGTTLQASGDVITPLKAITMSRVVGFVFAPILMFGWFGFPDLGLAGAAVANVLAQGMGAVVNYYALFRGSSRLHLTLRGYQMDFRTLGRLLRIGLPASLSGTERAISQLILLTIVTRFGDVAVASYSLARRVEGLANFGAMAIGNSSGIMVGQNLGAGRPDRARQSVGWGLLFVAAAKIVVALPLLTAPAFIVLLFTHEPGVVALTSVWLRILAVGAFFMGLGQVFQQSFNTAGATVSVMVVTLFSLVFIELPLAWVLTIGLGIGPLGIAYAQGVGMAFRAASFVPVFFWGRWLRVKVL